MLDLFPRVVDGTLRAHYLLLFGMAGLFALVAGFVGAWLGARAALRRGARAPGAAPFAGEDRTPLRALAESVEAVGLEVERVAESQRFLARMLLERRELPDGRARAGERGDAGSAP